MDPVTPAAAPAPAATPTTAAEPIAAAPAVIEPAPVAAPVSEAAPAAVVAPVTETTPVPAVEAAPASAVAAEPATETPTSLLGEAVKPAPESKPAEGDKPAEATDQAPVTEEAAPEAPLPTYEAFTVPEGVELDDAQVDKFVDVLGNAEREAAKDPTKIHAVIQAAGQKMLDLYASEMEGLGARVQEAQSKQFGRTQEQWKEAFFADPQIGGNRRQTTLQTCGEIINRFGGDAAQIAELKGVLAFTGAGNHPALIRLINNIGAAFVEGKPVPGMKPEPQQATRQARRYGKAT